MKRIFSILLIFAIIFSFAACKAKPEEETAPPPVVENVKHTKDFKNADGKVVIKVDVTLPQITKNCDESVKEYINKISMEIFNDACKFAESNIENASKFMAMANNKSPWLKTVTFETKLLDSRFACFIVKDAISYGGGETNPLWSTRCFDIKNGKECTLNDFTVYKDNPALGFETFLNDKIAPVFPDKFINPQFIDDSVMERLDEIFLYNDFYLTEKGMGFYIDKALIHEYLDGFYSMEFTWNELTSYYELDALDYQE